MARDFANDPADRGIRSIVERVYLSYLHRRASPYLGLERSAIVFTPHPDDETLGCGGTIARKVRAGARVQIVVMTDGSRSHAHLIDSGELARLRTEEMRRAAGRLGVDDDRLTFLAHEDGRLAESKEKAIAQVVALLGSERPEEVFVTYSGEAHADHRATTDIVRSALSALPESDATPTVYEYPIWTWNRWPFVPTEIGGVRGAAGTAARVVKGMVEVVEQFRCKSFIGDVLDVKRAALEEHRTQTSRHDGDERWSTFNDVAEGRWLECFFRNWELFRQVEYRARTP